MYTNTIEYHFKNRGGIAEMEKGSIYDEPLFRLVVVLVIIAAVIALVAANTIYF